METTAISVATIMTNHHRECDGYFSDMEGAISSGDWEVAQNSWKLFNGNTLNHFASEEEILFSAFEEATGSAQGPTMVMRMEHEQMRSLLQNLQQAVESRDAEQALGVADTLMIMMQQHNMKEEQMLYPMIDRSLPDTDSVMARMKLEA
jgi:iron-sulfur cluster repair protein YtfE (RIC family)